MINRYSRLFMAITLFSLSLLIGLSEIADLATMDSLLDYRNAGLSLLSLH